MLKPGLLSIRLTWLLATAVALGISSCEKLSTKSVGSNSLAVDQDYATLKVQVVDEFQRPVSGASVYVSEADGAFGTTDANGFLSTRVSDIQLQNLNGSKQAFRNGKGQFRFFIEFQSPEGHLVGMTAFYVMSRGTNLDLGQVQLSKPKSYQGTVVRYGGGGKLIPLEGMTIKGLRSKASSNKEGRFTLEGLPEGTFEISADHEGFEPAALSIQLDEEETKEGVTPLILFKENQIAGVLMEVEDSKFDPNHPYRKTFQVVRSKAAAKYQVSNFREEFSEIKVDRLVPSATEIAYDFPGIGEHDLFYRFYDEKSGPGEVLNLVATIEPPKQENVVVIEDGSGFVASTRFSVNLKPPGHYAQMRISQDPSAFTLLEGDPQLPWLSVQEQFEFVYDFSQRRLPDIGPDINSIVEVYVQFGNGFRAEGPVYHATAQLRPFEEGLLPFLIEGGSPTTTQRVVELTFDPPENAYEMVVFEEVAPGGGIFIDGRFVSVPIRSNLENYWMQVQTQLYFTFPTAGRKELYVQFRTYDKIRSPIYKQIIHVLPFDPVPYGFDINGGVNVSNSRNLVLDLFPPMGAVSFRVGNSLEDLNRIPFQSYVRSYAYRSEEIGLVNIFIQFQDIDGNSSYVSSREIYIDPFAEFDGDMTINNGDPVATSPLLYLDILPPPSAVDMQIAENADFLNFAIPGGRSQPWIPAAEIAEYLVSRTGTHTIYVRFRNDEGDVSTAIYKVITFDPFLGLTAPLVIDNGNTTTSDRIVDLTFQVTNSVAKYRIATSLENFESLPYSAIETRQWELPDQDGLYTFYVQFASVNGFESDVFQAQIELDQSP